MDDCKDWNHDLNPKQTIVYVLHEGKKMPTGLIEWDEVATWQYIGQQVRRICAGLFCFPRLSANSAHREFHAIGSRLEPTWSM